MSNSYDRDLNPIDSYSTDATKWAGKRVLKSVDRGFKLSTVWLSLDHQYGNGSPIVFETLIWDRDGEEVGGTRHYSEEAAARWHLEALDAIRAGAVPDYLNDDWMSAGPTSPDYADGGVTAAAIEKETEEPRTLTAADIEQLVTQNRYRVADAIRALYPEEPMATDVLAHTVMTALTEPTRPEGAEELADLIANADVGEWDCGDLADYLLSTGRVRVTGAES